MSRSYTWRTACLLIAVLAFFLPAPRSMQAAGADESPLPSAPPVGRYDKLAAISPFSPPTAAVPETKASLPPKPSWAEDWMLSSLLQFGRSYRVGLSRRTPSPGGASPDHVTVGAHDDNAEHISLVGVEWSDVPEKTRVTLRKGSETAVLTFDMNTLKAASAGAATPAPGQPGANSPPYERRFGRHYGGGEERSAPPGLPAGMPPPPPAPPTNFIHAPGRDAPISAPPGGYVPPTPPQAPVVPPVPLTQAAIPGDPAGLSVPPVAPRTVFTPQTPAVSGPALLTAPVVAGNAETN